ncbi:MAG: cytochrome c-type biogenesis protein CcmH [Rhodospirillaceae bacterium]|nr:cytochrome c-type biogenesis protein CcmH [Rhodospirillaceae bacterium]MCY4065633.1 cytochrome c-type biogenesis protein CcmH [Rhodospirillaceae bacterium]MDE0703346.1 cytochrome c-type biogenesis protein CcmH [Rhodospirillaceae bacterium]MXW91720.1 cytochrome c-type biogenesis protein CcmH [Rhodospirillaceae bacterium]MYB14472.1 cytochrome c-type biogenesis protein CcmH [Rhodospirillaceae bacterium]
MRRYAAPILLALFLALAAPIPSAPAIGPGEALKDAKLEDRARDIGRQLRCLVCQNQSIDDSDAPLARDLRRLVRKRLTAGDDDRQVIAYIHARYGDFVLLRPPVDERTWLLWFGPALALLVALAFLLWRLRRPRPAAPADSLSPEAAARADALLGDRGDEP